jgi:hypothetical protein
MRGQDQNYTSMQAHKLWKAHRYKADSCLMHTGPSLANSSSNDHHAKNTLVVAGSACLSCTRLADLGDIPDQLEDSISALSLLPFSRQLLRSICAFNTTSRRLQGLALFINGRLLSPHSIPDHSGRCTARLFWTLRRLILVSHAAHTQQTQFLARV